MEPKTFINKGIETGIKSYISYKNGDGVMGVSIAEFSIIKMLTDIYGEINITNPYKSLNEETLKKNLTVYGILDSEVNVFLNNIGKYHEWIYTSKPGEKTHLLNSIELTLINMILKKNANKKIPEEEIYIYDQYFSNMTTSINKVRTLINEEITKINKIWLRKKAQLNSNIKLEIIKPKLLPTELYLRYGLKLEEVTRLPNYKIDEINARIIAEESNVGGGISIDNPKQLVLTSGSGFVDTIVILSVITTEIMIGLIIAFIFYGR